MTATELYALLARFPFAPLLPAETPLHRLPRLEERLGRGPILIKRDDLTGVGIGGNKLRNLEYLLGEAEARGCDAVIAAGQTQSNLCALAAAAARARGMDCVLVHNSAEPACPRGNALLNRLFGAEERWLGPVPQEERERYAERLCREREARGGRPYLIRNGATSARGALGYVRAAAELESQMARGVAPRVPYVCVPGGNGGLAAGMIFGAALLGSPFRVEVLSVEHDAGTLRAILTVLLRELEALTGAPMGRTLDETADLIDDYRCGGWGITPPEVREFVTDFARLEGILVEEVYSGKMLRGMCALLAGGALPGGACFLHSGGVGALFDQLAEDM